MTATCEMELRPLRAIMDKYPKTVIIHDRFPMRDIEVFRAVALLD